MMTPPHHLRGTALAEWHRVATLLQDLPTRPDHADLADYCMRYAEWAERVRAVHEEGAVITTRVSRPQVNPKTRSAIDTGKHAMHMLADLQVPGVPPLHIA